MYRLERRILEVARTSDVVVLVGFSRLDLRRRGLCRIVQVSVHGGLIVRKVL